MACEKLLYVELGFAYDKDNKVKCTECGVEDVEIRDGMIFEHTQMCDFFRDVYMAKKENRLKTFEKWPRNINVSVEDLADNGFYYKGPWLDEEQCLRTDAVYCVHCNIMVFGWHEEHVVKYQHKIHSTFHRPDMLRSCPFTDN